MKFSIELSSNEFAVIQDALTRLEECYSPEEWDEVPELRKDFDAVSRKVEEANRSSFFWLMENYGHNTPTMWKFRSQEQAEHFLLKQNAEHCEDCSFDPSESGFLSDEKGGCLGVGWQDANGVIWEVCDGPEMFIIDMTGKE